MKIVKNLIILTEKKYNINNSFYNILYIIVSDFVFNLYIINIYK